MPSPNASDSRREPYNPAMALVQALLETESASDEAYPTHSPADAVYPCQTRAPLEGRFDGVATPAIWSRLHGALERALNEAWSRLGLQRRCRPGCWVTLHYGRMAVNAHGWERMRANLRGQTPDPALVEPPARGLHALPELWERLRVKAGRRKLAKRLRRAEVGGERALSKAAVRKPAELDTAELARGPLDERVWSELLLPWVGRRLAGQNASEPAPSLRAAIGVELRFAAELGRRLEARQLLRDPSGVAYLTVEERIQAVHEGSEYWAKLIDERQARVDAFLEIDVPERFWGRPRAEAGNDG